MLLSLSFVTFLWPVLEIDEWPRINPVTSVTLAVDRWHLATRSRGHPVAHTEHLRVV